jgi:hypothetical protein
MRSIMYETALAWTGLAVLFLLCLPFAGARRLILEVSGLLLRLALLALLAAGAALWFRPDLLPPEAAQAREALPWARDALPPAGSPFFGMAVALPVVAVLLPFLAVLDLARRASRRPPDPRPVETVAPTQAEPVLAVVEPVAEAPRPQPAHHPRRADRRAAAETMGDVGSRKPFRVADHLS